MCRSTFGSGQSDFRIAALGAGRLGHRLVPRGGGDAGPNQEEATLGQMATSRKVVSVRTARETSVVRERAW